MTRWLLALCTLLALALRLHGLLQQPLWFDEINSFVRADAASPLGVLRNELGDCQAPLHDLVTWALVRLFGDGELVARLPVALLGAALVPVTWLLARALFAGTGAALVAALLVAVAPPLVAYGQEARPYALFALLAALVLLAAARLVRSRGERGATLLAWSAPLLLLTHHYGTLVLLAVVLHLAANLGALRARIGRVVVALLPALAAGLLWSPIALWQVQGPDSAVVYSGLGARELFAALDAWSLEGAAIFAGDFARCRYVHVLLAAIGAALAIRARAPADGTPPDRDAAAPDPGAATDALRLRRAFLALLGAGLVALLAAVLWNFGIERMLTALAARLRGIGGEGRLDDDGRRFVAELRRLALAAGAGLLAAAALVRSLPTLARWMERAGAPRSPESRVPLLPVAIALPLAGAALLDALGVPTFILRHSIYAAAPLAVLVGGAVAGPGRRPRTSVALAAILLLSSVRGFTPSRPLRDYPDFRRVGALVNERRELAPLAHPDWTARCIEYYARRPWRSVAGVDDLEKARSFARAHDRFLLVTSYEGFESSTLIRSAIFESHVMRTIESPSGVRCELCTRR